MARWLAVSSSTVAPLRFSQKSPSVIPYKHPIVPLPERSIASSIGGFYRTLPFSCRAIRTSRALCTNAVLPEVPIQNQFPKVGAESTGPILSEQLLQVVETAAKTGAQVCQLTLGCKLVHILED